MGAEEKFLKPVSPDLILRDPRSMNILPAEGAMKPWIGPEGRYWRRRVADGSCVIVGEAPVAPEVKQAPKVIEKTEKVQSQPSKFSRDKEE